MNFSTEVSKIIGKRSNLKYWTTLAADSDFFGPPMNEEKHVIKIYKLIKKNLKQALESKIEYIKTFALLIRDHDDEAHLASDKYKYKKGDIVGIVADCMADCKVIKLLPNKEYELEAIKIHHPKPKESFFGKNKRFKARQNQITVKLG